jgi:RNAse (barnase) inhibitor barstar
MNPLPLLSVSSGSQLFLMPAAPDAAAEALGGWSDAGLVVRRVRGRKMRSWPGLFDEVAAALQFPWYFGENVDALSDCITDLDWLPRQAGFVIVVDEPGEVLTDADPGALARFVVLLRDAEERWAEPIEQGEWWDRPTVPFHVVLHVTDDSSGAQRWSDAGATVVPFPG